MGQAFGNFGLAAEHKGSARIAEANARVAKTQGKAEKGKAYGQATRMELENKVAGEAAAENMARLRENQRKAGATVETARAASGFSAEGSGSAAQMSVLEQYEQQAQDLIYGRSLQDVSSRFQATMLRRKGELAEQGAEAQGDYYNAQAQIYKMQAHNANKSAIVTGTVTAVGAYFGGAAGAQMGYQAGQGLGSMYSAGLPGSAESAGGRNAQAEKDFSAAINKGIDEWLK